MRRVTAKLKREVSRVINQAEAVLDKGVEKLDRAVDRIVVANPRANSRNILAAAEPIAARITAIKNTVLQKHQTLNRLVAQDAELSGLAPIFTVVKALLAQKEAIIENYDLLSASFILIRKYKDAICDHPGGDVAAWYADQQIHKQIFNEKAALINAAVSSLDLALQNFALTIKTTAAVYIAEKHQQISTVLTTVYQRQPIFVQYLRSKLVNAGLDLELELSAKSVEFVTAGLEELSKLQQQLQEDRGEINYFLKLFQDAKATATMLQNSVATIVDSLSQSNADRIIASLQRPKIAVQAQAQAVVPPVGANLQQLVAPADPISNTALALAKPQLQLN